LNLYSEKLVSKAFAFKFNVYRRYALAYYEGALAAARLHATRDAAAGGEGYVQGGAVKSSDVANWVVSELVGAAKKAAVAGAKEPLLGLPAPAGAARGGELLARVAAVGLCRLNQVDP
jgi:hypothetical protein